VIARTRTTPLGIDIGASRARVALALRAADGSVQVVAVASRDVPDGNESLLAALLEEMIAELGTRERRCVASIGVPGAALRILKLPTMTWPERMRVARFEARRFADWDTEEIPTHVRVQPYHREHGLFAVGAARTSALEARRRIVRGAGLRLVGVDHDAFALRRALPHADAIVDIGFQRSTLHVYEHSSVRSVHIALGGDAVTHGIAADLSIDVPSAERRKRILGSAGAGIAACDDLVRAIAGVIERTRARASVTRVALTGNGARLPGIADTLEAATGALVDSIVPDWFGGDSYPEDVLRSAAPDWMLAGALALWDPAA